MTLFPFVEIIIRAFEWIKKTILSWKLIKFIVWILHPKKKCPVIRYTDIHLPDPGVSRWEVMTWGLILGTCIYLHYQFSQFISDSEMRTHSIIQKLCYERQNCILPIVDLRYQVLKLLASASCFLNGNVSCGHIVPTHSPCVFWRFTGCAARHASPVTAIHSHGGGSLQLWIDMTPTVAYVRYVWKKHSC